MAGPKKMRREIIGIRETVKLNPRGELERWKVVEYMLDSFGPFIYEAPKELFSYADLRRDMDEQEEGLLSVQG